MLLAFNVFFIFFFTEPGYITLITLLSADPDSAISLRRFSLSQEISNFHERRLQVDLGVTLGIPVVTLVDCHCWTNHLNSTS